MPLIVYGMAHARGFDQIGLFSVAPLGLIYLGVGFVYLFTVGRLLIPEREIATDLSRRYDMRDFISELLVGPETHSAGRTLERLAWGQRYEVRVVGIQRGGVEFVAPGAGSTIERGDVVMVQGETIVDTSGSWAVWMTS